MALVRLKAVDAAQTVGERGAQARDLVVLVVDALLQVRHAIAQHLVLVLDHVVAGGGHARCRYRDRRGGHHQQAAAAATAVMVLMMITIMMMMMMVNSCRRRQLVLPSCFLAVHHAVAAGVHTQDAVLAGALVHDVIAVLRPVVVVVVVVMINDDAAVVVQAADGGCGGEAAAVNIVVFD